MLFKPEHREKILNRKKTATRRMWKRRMAKVGGIYKCKLAMMKKDYFAKIRVVSIYEQELKDMSKEDARKEGYDTLEEFKNVWIKINGRWVPDWKPTVIEFELV